MSIGYRLPMCIRRYWNVIEILDDWCSDKVFEIKIGLQKKGLHDIVGKKGSFFQENLQLVEIV